MSGSVKDNILFGHAFQEDRFWRMIQLCQLESDVERFQDGVETLIGERGVNISGG
jgi:ABC-type multidrug transport system fused ATPase/permease subunit